MKRSAYNLNKTFELPIQEPRGIPGPPSDMTLFRMSYGGVQGSWPVVDTRRFLKETKFGTDVTSAGLHIYLDEWKYRKKMYSSDNNILDIWGRTSSILNGVQSALNGLLVTFQNFLDSKSFILCCAKSCCTPSQVIIQCLKYN